MREKPLEFPIEPPTRHPVYYTSEGVTILVENMLFKVPRCMLEANAPNSADILHLSGEKEAGLTDDVPVRLEQVTAKDFERLLILIYPFITSDDYPSASWKTEEWTSVLHLATKWDMKSIRSMAMKNLNNVASSTSKVALGRKYDHPPWIQEGFMTLCLRADPLTEEEARELELKDVVGCAAARERVRAMVISQEPGTTMFSSARLGNFRVRIGKHEDGMKYMSNAAVRDIVENTFGIVTETPNPS